MRKSGNKLSGAKSAAANKIISGAFILVLWIASQFFQASLIPVYDAFDKAVDKFEGGYIIITAFWLIVNNAVRAILLYSGWFMLSDGLAERSGMKKIEWLLPLAGKRQISRTCSQSPRSYKFLLLSEQEEFLCSSIKTERYILYVAVRICVRE